MPFPPIYQKILLPESIFFPLRIFIASLERPLKSHMIYVYALCPQAIPDE